MSVTRGDGWYVQQPDDEADEIIVGIYNNEFDRWQERSFSPEEAQRVADALLDKIGGT